MFFASNSFTKIKIPDKNKHVIFFKNKKDKNECKDSKKAIFFDRDGVLIKDVNYIKETKDVSLLNGVPNY